MPNFLQKSLLILVLAQFLNLAYSNQPSNLIYCFSQTTDNNDPINQCPALHTCIDNHCIHKSIFPLTQYEIWSSLFLVIISGMANAGGIGGGALLTSLMLTIFKYSTSKASAIVYCMLFGSSLGNFVSVCKLRDKDTGKPLINYDIALICMPIMLMGTNLALIISKALPNALILLGMLIVNTIILRRTFKRTKIEFYSETQKLNNDSKNPTNDNEIELNRKMPKENKEIELKVINFINLEQDGQIDAAYYLIQEKPKLYQELKNDFNIFPMTKIKEILYLLGTLMIFTLIRGSANTPSFVDIKYCSQEYWFIHLCGILSCLHFSRRNLINYRDSIESFGDSEYITIFNYRIPNISGFKKDKIQALVNMSLLAGFLGGMMIGGGIIMNSYLLDMNLSPQSTAATMTLFLMLPFFMTTFVTIVSGNINFDEFVWFFGLSVLSSFLLSKIIAYLIQKYKRQSILLMSICLILLLVQVLVPTYAIKGMIEDPENFLMFHKLC